MTFPSSGYLKASFRFWLSCFIEWLLFLPLWIMLQAYLQSTQAAFPWLYSLPILSFAGVLLRHWCNQRWKQLLGAMLIGGAAGFLTDGFSFKGIPLVACGCIFAYLGITAAFRKNRLSTYITGIGVYFIAALVFARISVLQPSVSLLTWSGSLCLVLALLDSNSSHLRYASFTSEAARLPAGLRRHNRVFVIFFVGLAAALAAGGGKAVGGVLWNTVRLIFRWISRLFSGSTEPPRQEEVPPAALPELPAAEVHKAGLLAMMLDLLFYVLGGAAVLLVLYLALRWLYRNTGGLWRKWVDALLSMLRKESPKDTAAYQDEEKSIFTWEKAVHDFRDYWRTRLTPAARRDRWEEMTGSREQIRWLYRHWLIASRAEGYKVKGYLTPQETGADIAEWSEGMKHLRKGSSASPASSDQLLRLYNQARYGNEEPSTAAAAALKDQLKL